MSDDREALSLRAVVAWTACGLGWLPGMQAACCAGRTARADEFDAGAWNRDPAAFAHLLPDLDDHATLGCIEHGMLPETWGPGVVIRVMRWTGDDGTTLADIHVFDRGGASAMEFGVDDVPLAEGLVRCLEAAAERRRQR